MLTIKNRSHSNSLTSRSLSFFLMDFQGRPLGFGGNPFNQNLNTTSDVTFRDVGARNVTLSGTINVPTNTARQFNLQKRVGTDILDVIEQSDASGDPGMMRAQGTFVGNNGMVVHNNDPTSNSTTELRTQWVTGGDGSNLAYQGVGGYDNSNNYYAFWLQGGNAFTNANGNPTLVLENDAKTVFKGVMDWDDDGTNVNINTNINHTVAGDILVGNGTTMVPLSKGSNFDVLGVRGGVLAYAPTYSEINNDNAVTITGTTSPTTIWDGSLLTVPANTIRIGTNFQLEIVGTYTQPSAGSPPGQVPTIYIRTPGGSPSFLTTQSVINGTGGVGTTFQFTARFNGYVSFLGAAQAVTMRTFSEIYSQSAALISAFPIAYVAEQNSGTVFHATSSLTLETMIEPNNTDDVYVINHACLRWFF